MSNPDGADDLEPARASVRLVRENQLLRIHATVSRLVAQQRDPGLIRDEACRLLVEQGGFALAWIGLCEADGAISVASCHGEKHGYAAGIEVRWDDTPLGRGPTGVAVRERRAVVMGDAETIPDFLPWSGRASAHGLGASASIPLLAGPRVLGALMVYAEDSGPFDAALVGLLGEVGELLGFALQVAEESQARREAGELLRASEERHRILFEQNPQPMCVYDRGTLAILAANQAMLARYGYTRDEMLAMTVVMLRPEEDRARFLASVGRPAVTPRTSGAWRHLTKAGEVFEVEVSVSDLLFEGREARLVLAVDVTEREAARRALEAADEEIKRARDFYQQVLDCLPVPAWRRDAEGALVFGNKAYLDFGGAGLARMSGVRDDTPLHPDDRARANGGWVKAQRERGPFSAEMRLRNAAGEYRTCLAEARPLFGADGAFLGHVGAWVDIHDRKQMEEALRASEELARTAFNASPDIMTMSELESGAYVAVNDAFVRLSGYSREEVLGHAPSALGFWARPEDRGRLLAEMAKSRRVEGFETRVRVRDGRELTASMSVEIAPFRGRLCVISSIRDVTEERRIEAERARLLAAIEQMAEVLIVTDAEARIILVNPAFERVTGFARAEVVGKNPRLLKSGQQNDAFYAAMWATLTRGETFRSVLINRRRDGSRYHAEVVISPVRDAAGVTTHYVGVQRDTTQEHALQAQLLHAQKMEVVGRVAGGVAHDFNNILTAILSSAHFLLEDLPEGDVRRADAEVVQESAERAAALTRQLLAFSRKEIVAPRDLDLNALLVNLSKMLARLLREDIALQVTPCAGEAPLHADAGQLEQVVMNLVVNAREAISGPGWIAVRTRLEAASAGDEHAPHGYVVIEVEDSGAGMSAATRARIFEPFFTTKERGTGLGLATVRSIVEGLRGTIALESAPGRGTCFGVHLPLSAQVSAAAAVEAAASLAAPRPTRVLLVEDDGAVRALFARTLELHGYAVTPASSVDDATQKAAALGAPLDVVLTDVVLPDGSGYALARALGAEHPALRVLLMSGYTADVELLKEIGESGVAFVAKPCTPRGILLALRALLAGEPGG
jgi:PAS domain S-box-containing protein